MLNEFADSILHSNPYFPDYSETFMSTNNLGSDGNGFDIGNTFMFTNLTARLGCPLIELTDNNTVLA